MNIDEELEVDKLIKENRDQQEQIKKLNKKAQDENTFEKNLCSLYAHENKELKAQIEQLKAERRWIPVSERLPSNEECNLYDYMHPCYRKFLCTMKFNNGFDNFYRTRELYFDEYFGWKCDGVDYNEHVIAWQTLLEPYEEDDK